MTLPNVTIDQFAQYTGIAVAGTDADRVEVMLDRARRRLVDQLPDVPDDPSEDDVSDWVDAVAEYGWFLWEGEKSSNMEILSMPVSQLSLGTLFWTKEHRDPLSDLPAVQRVVSKWGGAIRRRFVLMDELDYPA